MSLRIEGDQLEQHRIRLERDIANTIPSPPTMSPGSTREDYEDDASSVDLPRHNSNPRHSFHSFEHPSHFDSDIYSRHGDEDSVALDPDLGHTLSTAAHHASALTLTAGLRGRDYTPVKSPHANQEFDPHRPLQPMLGAADGLSMFNSTFHSKTTTKSNKNSKLDQYTFDPIIVDSTAELDRFLKTGFRQPNISRSGATHHYLNRSHSQPEPQIEVENDSAQLKSPLSLSQALSSQFSPKRPRSTPTPIQSFQFPKRSDTSVTSNTVRSNLSRQPEISRPTQADPEPQPQPKQGDRPKEKLSTAGQQPTATRGRQSHSRIHFQEPIDNDKTPRPRKIGFAPDAVSSVQRPILVDRSNKHNEALVANERSKANVHLPDVTNLTAAVESPLRGGEGYLAAKGEGSSGTQFTLVTDPGVPVANRRFAADVAAALDGLQSRLDALERDNGISRRRVKDLEYELEECKAEVAYERKKMKARELNKEAERDSAVQEEEMRYRNAVEEKKSLEVLVATMREHVARLTSEVALHRSLIDGLRRDVDASEEVQVEVQTLSAKVERLGGEVERLRAFVEEGVRERERSRDISAVSFSRQEQSVATGLPSQVGFDITYVTNPLAQNEERPVSRTGQALVDEFVSQTQDLTQPPRESQETSASASEEEPFQEPEEDEDVENRPNYTDEDEPTPPDDQPVETTEHSESRSQRYIEDSELAKVQAEVSERRSERSFSMRASLNGSRANESENSGSEKEGRNSPVRGPSPAPSNSRFGALPSRSRPSELDNLRNMAHRQTSNPLPFRRKPSSAFPQIRGSRMERLFFAAPDHDPMTCHVCHSRKRRGFELYQECSPEEDEQHLRAYFQTEGAGRRKKTMPENGETRPPQTILTHVLQDLEDDFSHYKAIYIELAEQYAVIDAVSNVAKRNVLADHLREVIDSLEQKGDQIASLYELLHFQDKPLGSSKSRHAAAFV